MEQIEKQLKDIQEKNKGNEIVNDLVEISLTLLAYMNKQTTTELYARLLDVEQTVGIRRSKPNSAEEARNTVDSQGYHYRAGVNREGYLRSWF